MSYASDEYQSQHPEHHGYNRWTHRHRGRHQYQHDHHYQYQYYHHRRQYHAPHKDFRPELAVSFTAEIPNFWEDSRVLDCLNYQLAWDSRNRTSKPVVICRRSSTVNEREVEYYVELYDEKIREIFLELNGVNIRSGSLVFRPRIEPWQNADQQQQEQHQQQEQGSHSSQRRDESVEKNSSSIASLNNNNSGNMQQDSPEDEKQNDKNDAIKWNTDPEKSGDDMSMGSDSSSIIASIDNDKNRNSRHDCSQDEPKDINNEIIERKIDKEKDSDGSSERPSKRARTTSLSEQNTEDTSSTSTSADIISTGQEVHANKINASSNAPDASSPRLKRKKSIENSNCKLLLTTMPNKYNAESFRKYLNSHLIDTKIVDDISSESPILECYCDRDNWVLTTRTEEIRDIIMNSVSGTLTLTGTKVYFKRHPEYHFSREGTSNKRHRIPSSPSPSPTSSQSTGCRNNREDMTQSLPLPSWSNVDCIIHASNKSKDVSWQEVASFIICYIRGYTTLANEDVIIDTARFTPIEETQSFLCSSAVAAQTIVTKINGIDLRGSKLSLNRHPKFRQDVPPVDTDTNDPTRPIMDEFPGSRGSTKDDDLASVEEGEMKKTQQDSSLRRGENDKTQKASDNSYDKSPPIAQSEERQWQAIDTELTMLNENEEERRCDAEHNNVNPLAQDAIIHCTADQPIEMGLSNDERSRKISGKTEYDKIKSQYDTTLLELEKSKIENIRKDKQIIILNNISQVIEKRIESEKKEAKEDYERRLHEIQLKKKEQSLKIEEQQEIIQNLKADAEKARNEIKGLYSKLQGLQGRYQEMTDALTCATKMCEEEREARRQLTVDVIGFKKAKKAAERKLKALKSLADSKGTVGAKGGDLELDSEEPTAKEFKSRALSVGDVVLANSTQLGYKDKLIITSVNPNGTYRSRDFVTLRKRKTLLKESDIIEVVGKESEYVS